MELFGKPVKIRNLPEHENNEVEIKSWDSFPLRALHWCPNCDAKRLIAFERLGCPHCRFEFASAICTHCRNSVLADHHRLDCKNDEPGNNQWMFVPKKRIEWGG